VAKVAKRRRPPRFPGSPYAPYSPDVRKRLAALNSPKGEFADWFTEFASRGLETTSIRHALIRGILGVWQVDVTSKKFEALREWDDRFESTRDALERLLNNLAVMLSDLPQWGNGFSISPGEHNRGTLDGPRSVTATALRRRTENFLGALQSFASPLAGWPRGRRGDICQRPGNPYRKCLGSARKDLIKAGVTDTTVQDRLLRLIGLLPAG
jgi:hypothetical protein